MLTPLIITAEELDALDTGEDTITEIEPSRTYRLNFETGEITTEMVDGSEAIKQAVIKALRTVRDKYLIYSEDTGSELTELLGKAYQTEYLELVVPRLIEEALINDERIEELVNFDITVEVDVLNISFEIIAQETGESIPVEVTI